MSGDVSANGKVLPIGDVSSKVRGAEVADCRVLALALSNLDDLINMPAFIEKGEVPQLQIIGVDNVGDAIAVLRTDRSKQLSQALDLYDEVAKGIRESATYINTPACSEKLSTILKLCPHHLSAQLLSMSATGKRPKSLSVTASIYYISIAIEQVLPMLNESTNEPHPSPALPVVAQGVIDLDNLRAVCHPSALQLLDACSRYLRIISAAESGSASLPNLDGQRQHVLDAMSDLGIDPELLQKRLEEGI
jgi:hypothetical protein